MAFTVLSRLSTAARSQCRYLATAEQVLQKHGVKTADKADGVEFFVRFEKSPSGGVTLVFSPDTAIDEAKANFPEVVARDEISDGVSFERLAYKYGLLDWQEGGAQLKKLYEVFAKSGAASLQVNRFVQTATAELYSVSPVFSSPNRLAEL